MEHAAVKRNFRFGLGSLTLSATAVLLAVSCQTLTSSWADARGAAWYSTPLIMVFVTYFIAFGALRYVARRAQRRESVFLSFWWTFTICCAHMIGFSLKGFAFAVIVYGTEHDDQKGPTTKGRIWLFTLASIALSCLVFFIIVKRTKLAEEKYSKKLRARQDLSMEQKAYMNRWNIRMKMAKREMVIEALCTALGFVFSSSVSSLWRDDPMSAFKEEEPCSSLNETEIFLGESSDEDYAQYEGIYFAILYASLPLILVALKRLDQLRHIAKEIIRQTLVVVLSVSYFVLSSEIVKKSDKGATDTQKILFHCANFFVIFLLAAIMMRFVDGVRNPVSRIQASPVREILRAAGYLWYRAWPIIVGLVAEQLLSCIFNIVIESTSSSKEEASATYIKANGVNFGISFLLLLLAAYFFGDARKTLKEAEVDKVIEADDMQHYSLLEENEEEEEDDDD